MHSTEMKKEQTDLDNLKNICQCNISQCLYRLGEYRQAIGVLTKALQYMPNNVKALYHRSRAYRALDEYDNAMKDLDKAKQIDPNNVSVRNEIISLKNTISAARSEDKRFASNVLSLGARVGGSSKKSSSSSKQKIDSDIAFIFEDNAIPLEPNLYVNCGEWTPQMEASISPEVWMDDDLDNHS